jgi:hypothetical protein
MHSFLKVGRRRRCRLRRCRLRDIRGWLWSRSTPRGTHGSRGNCGFILFDKVPGEYALELLSAWAHKFPGVPVGVLVLGDGDYLPIVEIEVVRLRRLVFVDGLDFERHRRHVCSQMETSGCEIEPGLCKESKVQ